MHDNRLWSLIARQLSGEASADEIKEIQSLLQQFPDKQYLLEMLHSYFSAHATDTSANETEDAGFEERFMKIIESGSKDQSDIHYTRAETANRANSFRFKKFWYAAASLSGIMLTVWISHRLMQPVLPQKDMVVKSGEIVAKPGARTKLELPDGTQVWLNSGSKLNYQSDFNARFREVDLEGEAFFDVVKDAEHPFIVHVSSINIKVLGTAFAVKSYPKDETVEATLLRGMIEVTRTDNPSAPKVLLKPNEKLTFNKRYEKITQDGTSSNRQNNLALPVAMAVTAVPKTIPDSEKVETSWMYNRLTFNGDSFVDLAAKMERWYNVKIILKSEHLLKYRFKGTFAGESVRDALDALQLTAKFKYKINNNEIEIYE